MKKQAVLSFILLVSIFGSCARAFAGESKAAATHGGPTFDRLAWLAGLIDRLGRSDAPACVGPRGCSADIPADSPCTRPVSKRPDIVVDGVLPGGAKGVWAVAYRRMCSACYLGGEVHLALIRVEKKGTPRILETLSLRKDEADEIPGSVEMVSRDVDDDDRLEMVVRYQTERERAQKCSGLQSASAYYIVVRAEKLHLTQVLTERTEYHPPEKGRPYSTEIIFSDRNDDGYPDLVLKQTMLPDVSCREKKAKCHRNQGTETTVRVRRYVEERGKWDSDVFVGYSLSDGEGVRCDVPLPETPFAVVAETLPGARPERAMEAKAAALRDAGFEGACLYKGEDYKGLKSKHVYVIVSAHAVRSDADAAASTLRKAGFRPFVKELFQ